MKARIRYLFLFVFLFHFFLTYSQVSRVDSLENILKNTTQDTTRANILALLCSEYRFIGETDKALASGMQGIAVAKKTNYDIGLAQNINNVGNVHFFKGDITIALDYYKQAQLIWEKLTDTKDDKQLLRARKGIASALANIGNVYFNASDYPNALDYQLRNLEILESLGNEDGIARCFRNLGDLYLELSDYSKALNYQLRSLAIAKKIGHKRSICHSLSNIGAIYQELRDYPKAFNFQLASLQMAREINDKQRIGRILNAIGTIYESASDSDCIQMHIVCSEKYIRALEYQQKSLEINEEISDKRNIAGSLAGISRIFLKQKKYPLALEYGEKAFDLFHEMGNLKSEKDILFTLYQIHKATGTTVKALEQYEKFVLLKDSIFKQEKQKIIIRKQMEDEYEKKEAEIRAKQTRERAVAASESARQKSIIYFTTAVALSVALIAFIIFRSLRVARRQKLIIEKQKALVDAKNKHITDSIYYAKRIQESILMKEEEVAKVLPFESFIFFQPKDIVSGDFYWLSYAKGLNRQHVIAAADCTGHGVPGAFLSMIGNMLLNEIVNERKITGPAEILKGLHHGIYHTLHHETQSAYSHDGMDIALCTIDTEKQTVSYAGANNPLYIILNTKEGEPSGPSFEIKVVKADNVSLGDNLHRIETAGELSFSSHEMPVQKGMRIYLFSDGYMDQYHKDNKKRMGSTQFKKLLLESAHLSMQEQKKYLVRAFHAYMGAEKQVDDVLVIGIKI